MSALSWAGASPEKALRPPGLREKEDAESVEDFLLLSASWHDLIAVGDRLPSLCLGSPGSFADGRGIFGGTIPTDNFSTGMLLKPNRNGFD
jgi:hypothetical protein